MRKWILAIAAIVLCSAAAAQNSPEEFQARYERLVRSVGASGVGVETLIDRWEEAFPDDPAAAVARFSYYFQRSQSTKMVSKGTQRRYLGNAPTFTLKDADGQDVNFFQEDFYDEDDFAEAMRVLDRQISLHPNELRFIFLRISALTAYEKEYPDMAAAALIELVKRHAASRKGWTIDGEPADDEIFQQGVGELCAEFFRIGSPASYEYFREVSDRMSKHFPKNPAFIDNLGSYQQAVKHNDQQAAKYYRKALKLDPDDYAARTNLQTIERKKAQAKKK